MATPKTRWAGRHSVPARLNSIRWRVVGVVTAVVGVVLAVAGAVVVTTFEESRASALDRELETRSHSVVGPLAMRMGGIPPHAPGPRGETLAFPGSFFRVLRNGSVLMEQGNVPTGFPVSTSSGYLTTEIDGESWRGLTTSLTAGPGEPPLMLQMVTTMAPLAESVSAVENRVMIAGAIGFVAAALLAAWLGSLALAPLSRLRAASARVTTAADLSRRLPEGSGPTEVKELSHSVNSMLARLERSVAETESALETTREFASHIGHEIRTPLTSMRANLDVLSRNPALLPQARSEVIEDVVAEQERLVALLDLLQTLARGESGSALPRGTLDVAAIAADAASHARRRHPHLDIAVSGAPDTPSISGWPDGLRVVVDNLLENAATYSTGRIRVNVAPRNADGGCVLTVDDDGAGIPEDERERVLEPFERGTGARGSGSGLGLALVAQQARLHGGDVRIGGSPLGGARLEVTLSGMRGAFGSVH